MTALPPPQWRPCSLCAEPFCGPAWACRACREWAGHVVLGVVVAGALLAFVIVSWGGAR